MWAQRQLRLPPLPRGVHLITRHVVEAMPELANLRVGLLHVQILHTSASLTINENASPDVRVDLEHALNRLAPDDDPAYTHTLEGPDDMPSHIKMALTRTSETIPFADGRLLLGTWQGIFLWEHRSTPHTRCVVLTLVT